MIYGFLSLVTTTSMFAFGIIGTITVINKAGHFLKTMEEEKKDAYKKAFDKFMIETIDEINFSIDSLKLISKHTLKNSKLLFDLVSGNKCIKKDKDGNIIVSDKSKLTEEYKEKIEHLYYFYWHGYLYKYFWACEYSIATLIQYFYSVHL